MHKRVIRRGVTAAIAAPLMTTVAVFADTVPADGDAVPHDNQSLIDLGKATRGQVITRSVSFNLTCAGLSHSAPGTTIPLEDPGRDDHRDLHRHRCRRQSLVG